MDEAMTQSLRNQLVIMQSISQLLPSANVAQNWINTECQKTAAVLSKAEAVLVPKDQVALDRDGSPLYEGDVYAWKDFAGREYHVRVRTCQDAASVEVADESDPGSTRVVPAKSLYRYWETSRGDPAMRQ